LLNFFEEMAPAHLAEDYDNVGLLVEGRDEITKILIALDADEKVVLAAEELGAELIVTHHPVMFRPVNRLTEAEGSQRTLRRLLQKGIGLFAMHTNYDSAENGLCDSFMAAFGEFSNQTSFSGERSGIGRIGTLKESCSVAELLERARSAFGGAIRYVGDKEKTVSRIALCNGGGGDMVYEAYDLGAQVYISGDFKHHHARFAYENDFNLIEIDHYDAEVGFCREVEKKLKEAFGDALSVSVYPGEKSPWQSYSRRV
ncbi:MAG: Nif3-like dinuclear metal center hexameric protein, partial [Clostridia bacterium]|nr:Nif3-like dinuclear metal center hexameric protein [Clostridia bacterium]